MFQPPKWTHVTLPSVEGVNILRDPPRSIVTRRINKVGEDNSLVELTDGSGDRVCEAINVYARGVNPMVEVAYSNNSGFSTRGSSHVARQGEAFLPYRIMDSGAFRAPIIAPTELLPLSRLPRVHTFAHANPGFVDFTKSIACGTNAKNTKQTTLQGSVAPTKFLRRESNQQFDPSPSIKQVLHADVRSNPRGYTKIDLGETDVQLERNRPVATGYTNLSGMKTAAQHNPETTVIKRSLKYDSYDARPLMPQVDYYGSDYVVKTGVGSLKPGNVKTRIN